MKLGSSMSASSASKQEVQDDLDDQKTRARTTVIIAFAAFGAIVTALRVGKSGKVQLASVKFMCIIL